MKKVKCGEIYWYDPPEKDTDDSMYCLILSGDDGFKSAFCLKLLLGVKIKYMIKGVLLRDVPILGDCVANYKHIHHLNRDCLVKKVSELSEEQLKSVTKKVNDRLLPIIIHNVDLFLEERREK